MDFEELPVSPFRTWTNTYFVLTVACGFLLFWQLFAETEFHVAAKLIFLAVFILTLKRWTGAALFAFCQAQLLVLERSSPEPFFTWDALLWAGLSLGTLAVLSRYRTLQERDFYPVHKSTIDAVRGRLNGKPPEINGIQVSQAIQQLAKLAAILMLCSIAAWTILGFFPIKNTLTGLNTIREYRLRPSGYRLLVCLMSLFAAFLVVWLFVNEVCWRRMNGRQARIHLNSVLLKFLYRDFRMVSRKRLKRRRKQVKTPHPDGDIPIID